MVEHFTSGADIVGSHVASAVITLGSKMLTVIISRFIFISSTYGIFCDRERSHHHDA
jgi:hypothetical protein